MIRLENTVTYLSRHKLKIIKRKNANPISSSSIFLIPFLFYFTGKISGTNYNELEWIWYPVILVLFITWLLFNFKFVNK